MDTQLYERDAPTVDGFERDLVESVSADEPWALVERFAELTRVSGTADERAAADYIVDRLADLGVAHEVYHPELYLSTPDRAAIRTGDGWSSETAKTVSFSANASVTGDLVYVENDDEMESIEAMLSVDLAGTDEDLDGAVVLAESIIPISAIEELTDRGVAAFVGIHPHAEEPHEGIVTPVWGGAPPLDEADRVPDLPVANVSRTEGEELAAMAAEGATVTVETETTTGWQTCPLVVARIQGEAAPDTDEFVLLHGHYDSWHVGITDNATGDAGLLECARVLNDHREHLRRDVRIAWWPGHSTGRYAGSTWYADEFALDLADNCVAHVNMDSPGVADATEFDVRAKCTTALATLAERTIHDVTGKPTREARVSRAGDYSFSNVGVPGLSPQSSIPDELRAKRGYHPVGGSGGHADAWHLTTDTIEKADPEVLVRDIQVFAVVVARLCAEETLPVDVAHQLSRHRTIVEDYDASSSLDLSPVLDELDALAESADRLDDEGAEANATRAALAKRLTRLNYTSEGPFQQDPAEARPPYPTLEPATRLDDHTGDDHRFLALQLRRARTDVVAQLRAARRAL
ncbi:M28 family peptidase [Halomarina rubra]|uniref:M28 family peptidase n=1 Tax=Halomarina rubra TaxID=2071873 RepID=A0ABD6AY69_9EURY|nr:M28 family peptidase [Halomarina rubra]